MYQFILLFLVIVLISLLYKFHQMHLKIDFRSFFYRGFHKTVDDFGVYVFTGKQRNWENFYLC